jgi:probable HAF family extracellular repeat protein
VGTYAGASGTSGFLYSGGTFSNIGVPGAILTSPSGINSAGQVVGFYDITDNVNHHGFLFLDGSFSTIDVPGATATQALGINDMGQIVGTYSDAGGEHGFLYLGGTFSTIDVPGATSTSAGGINNAGEMVGTYSDATSVVHGFLYQGGAFSSPEAPGGELTQTLGINDAGQIVGVPGFLYSGGVFSTIDVPGAAGGTNSEGINNTGQIAGFYFDASGAVHGFLATPIVQPSLTAVSTPTGSFTQGQPQAAYVTASNGASVPTSVLTSALTSTAGACDVNNNGVTNVADVQRIIDEALGAAQAVNDLNDDGVVNVVDIQVVINAALGLGCTPVSAARTLAVAHLTVQSGNGQAACLCFGATLQEFQPIYVKATDANGNPVAGATVNWTKTSGQMMLTSSTSITGSDGTASQSMSIGGFVNVAGVPPYLVSTIQAASNNNTVIFTETQSLVATGVSAIKANPPTFNGANLGNVTLSANIGTTLATPIVIMMGGFGTASDGVANISARILNEQTSPTLTCAGEGGDADPGSVLSDVHGNTTCYPMFSGSGSGTYYVLIGGVPGTDIGTALYLQAFGPFNFTSLPGAPAAVQIVSGNNQVGNIGQTLNPLVAKLVDANGNIVQGQTMIWSVAPAGAVGLNIGNEVTDSNGEVSTTVRLDLLASAGAAITVALKSNPNISATFQETIFGALTALNKIGGDKQIAPVGTSFATPLVVQLVNASGPVAYFPVQLLVSGPVSVVGGATAYTDVNGEASVTVTAGAQGGTATVTAMAAALTQTFTLTITNSPADPPPNGIAAAGGNSQRILLPPKALSRHSPQ